MPPSDAASSPNSSSGSSADEPMDDAPPSPDADETMADGDNDDDDDDSDASPDYDDSPLKSQQQRRSKDAAPTSPRHPPATPRHPPDHEGSTATGPISKPARLYTGASVPFFPTLKPAAVRARLYDIVPTIAAPHSTSINTITATPDMRHVFSGGADGWIRKFHWPDTVNSKAMLTVAQRHPFVDSVVKAGVLTSYWENEEPGDKTDSDEGPNLSPVYALAVQHQALWLLSGTEMGAINVQSIRHGEGKRITSLSQHTSAVSVMQLSGDEQALLSGSWDKTVLDWDLNTGQVRRRFAGSGSQISSMEMRPLSGVAVPADTYHQIVAGTTTAAERSRAAAQAAASVQAQQPPAEAQGSPMGSLFGDDDVSLFGDPNAAPSGGVDFGDEDEFSRAIANDTQQEREEQMRSTGNGDGHGAPAAATPAADGAAGPADADANGDGDANGAAEPENKTPAADAEMEEPNGTGDAADSTNTANHTPPATAVHDPPTPFTPINGAPTTSESVFLDSAIDGTIRIWDRRQPRPLARIVPGRNVPPWCMHACWSPDGNFIYAGRRNGVVDEYSLHKGLREPTRSLKFPGGSGPVSAVRPMPNGRHLVCASYDILRLYDLQDEESAKHARVPFLIVPGHRTGVVSQLFVDATCSFMISTGGNRGWEGATTEVLLGYEIGCIVD